MTMKMMHVMYTVALKQLLQTSTWVASDAKDIV